MTGGGLTVGQDGLWVLAIIVEYGAGVLVVRGWPVRSATLWSERHQLIVIVALGEAFIGLGLGHRHTAVPGAHRDVHRGHHHYRGAVVGYFEVLMPASEHALHCSSGARAALARDAYSLLHLPIVAGIVLLSLGLEKTLGVANPYRSTGWSVRWTRQASARSTAV